MSATLTKLLVTALFVREIPSRKVVRRIPVDPPEPPGSRRLEKITVGLLQKVDLDRFFVDEELGGPLLVYRMPPRPADSPK